MTPIEHSYPVSPVVAGEKEPGGEPLRGVTARLRIDAMIRYLEQIDRAFPDLPVSIHGLRPIKDMLPIWRGEKDSW